MGTLHTSKESTSALQKATTVIPMEVVNRFCALCVAVAVLVVPLAGCVNQETLVTTPQSTLTSEPGTHSPAAHTEEEVDLPHIHGIGFSADGQSLFVAAHDGLRVFTGGEWSVPDLPRHDYMGYSATDEGFYSSGHPHPSSSLVNPLGLVKSTDSGNTLDILDFAGESDFHLMTVGYENHAVYVLNSAQNSKLSAGLHYTLDDGKIWQQSALEGLAAQPFALAVHPTDATTVALATEAGLLLSTDYGDTFSPITAAGTPVTAVTFSFDGAMILYGYQTLQNFKLASQQSVSVSSPALASDDAVSYIAMNPAQPDTVVFATFNRDLYLSEDGGETWQQIAQAGATKNLE